MDVEIHTTTPSGSPLLAYGTTSAPSGIWKFLRWMGLAALIALVIGSAIYTFTARIAVPARTFLVAIVPGGSRLPSQSPDIWQSTVDGSKLPVLIGLAMLDDRPVPFTVRFGLEKADGPAAATKGAFITHSERSPSTWEERPAQALLRAHLGMRAAHLSLFPSVLGLHKLPDMDGDIIDGGWHTNIDLPTPATTLSDGEIAIDISALPDAFEPIRLGLRGAGHDIPDELPPPSSLAIQWTTPTSSGLRLEFLQQVSTSTMSLVHRQDRPYGRTYSLPDGSLTEEVTAFGVATTATTMEPWQTDGLAWQTLPFTRSQVQLCAHGLPVLRIERSALTRIATLLDIPHQYRPLRFEATSHEGRLFICAKFE